jgi:hypothetical protein
MALASMLQVGYVARRVKGCLHTKFFLLWSFIPSVQQLGSVKMDQKSLQVASYMPGC